MYTWTAFVTFMPNCVDTAVPVSIQLCSFCHVSTLLVFGMQLFHPHCTTHIFLLNFIHTKITSFEKCSLIVLLQNYSSSNTAQVAVCSIRKMSAFCLSSPYFSPYIETLFLHFQFFYMPVNYFYKFFCPSQDQSSYL